MIPENMRLVFIATLSIAVRESSAIPLNCTVTSHPEMDIDVQIGTNSTFTCKISRQTSNTTIEVIQCYNNFTDCQRDPGILIGKYDINRSSTGTIVTVRNHSEELRVSCYDPYVKDPSTHLELPNDCWRPNHTDKYDVNRTPTSTILNTTFTDDANGDAGANNTVVPSNLSPVKIFFIVFGILVGIVGSLAGAGVVWMIRTKRCKCPESITTRFRKHKTRNEEDTAMEMPVHGESAPFIPPHNHEHGHGSAPQEDGNNDNRANACDSQHSSVRPDDADTTPEEKDNAKGTTGMKDGFILHAEQDKDLARKIKLDLESDCDANVKPFVDVSADEVAGQSEFSSLDTILMKYRWILLLATTHSNTDGLLLFKGQAILLDDLNQPINDQQHRIIPMLYQIKRTDLKQSWLRVITPLKHSDGIKKVVELICEFRKLTIPKKPCDAKK